MTRRLAVLRSVTSKYDISLVAADRLFITRVTPSSV